MEINPGSTAKKKVCGPADPRKRPSLVAEHTEPSEVTLNASTVTSDLELETIKLNCPVTPGRPMPNSGKKRTGPNLSRQTPGSSHHDSISHIFQDAGRRLQSTPTPPSFSAEARRHRTPFPAVLSSWKRTVNLGDNDHASIEPISNGFTTPAPPNQTTPSPFLNKEHYPDLTRPSSNGCVSQDRAGTEERKAKDERACSTPAVESWLQNTIDGRSSAMVEETMGPVTPTCAKDQQPFRLHMVSGQAQGGKVDSPIARTSFSELYSKSASFVVPRGQALDLRKRKAPRLSPVKPQTPAEIKLNFVIYDDGSTDPLADVSPAVEQFRKGRRPKRDRCTSYWDEDVLPELSQSNKQASKETSGRQVLGDLPELTKPKGFMEGIENTQFVFAV
ncbi:MAG: hypothetical protein Q9174_000610 [Haloplaca sp. 1 TL-2023]